MPRKTDNAPITATPIDPEARVFASLEADPKWLPTERGDTRVVNRMLDDGELRGTFSGRGILTGLEVTGLRTDAATIAKNFLHKLPVPGSAGAFIRALRDGIMTVEHIVQAVRELK